MKQTQEDKIISEFLKSLGPWRDLSDQTLVEFSFLGQQHPKWLQTFQKQLSHWMDHASPIEWSQLEAQDPSRKLRKLSFERSIKILLGWYQNAL